MRGQAQKQPSTATWQEHTVIVPLAMPMLAMVIMAVRPAEKIRFWPVLRKDRELCV